MRLLNCFEFATAFDQWAIRFHPSVFQVGAELYDFLSGKTNVVPTVVDSKASDTAGVRGNGANVRLSVDLLSLIKTGHWRVCVTSQSGETCTVAPYYGQKGEVAGVQVTFSDQEKMEQPIIVSPDAEGVAVPAGVVL